MSIAGAYIDVDGTRTYYEDAGEGPVLLLIHTAGRDNRQWHGVMDRLEGRFRMLAPDLPGHGKSWPLNGQECLDEVTEIAAWLSSFMTATGVEEYAVCGCSLGGNLALLIPAMDKRVRATVSMQGADFTPTISETNLRMMRHPLVNLSYSNMDFTMSLVGSGAESAGRSFIEWGVTTVNSPAQRGDLTAYTRCDIRNRMDEITVPVTMVHGTDDWVVAQWMVEETATRIVNAPSVELVSLEGLGHFPHVESPQTIAELLDRVL